VIKLAEPTLENHEARIKRLEKLVQAQADCLLALAAWIDLAEKQMDHNSHVGVMGREVLKMLDRGQN
jgi:hypothetical protein